MEKKMKALPQDKGESEKQKKERYCDQDRMPREIALLEEQMGI
jgi:hypothetical protein